MLMCVVMSLVNYILSHWNKQNHTDSVKIMWKIDTWVGMINQKNNNHINIVDATVLYTTFLKQKRIIKLNGLK